MKAESSGTELESWPPSYTLDGKYEIIRLIETTKRCEIYQAGELQPPYDRVVVKRLKLAKIKDDDARGRFEREIVVLRQIRHQSVLCLYDSKTAGQDRYFVTEYADRGTLSEYLAAKPDHKLRPIEALEIALSVCQGLKAAHRQGIIHRDVKPGNIFLFSKRDESIMAKLADFSFARVPDELSDKPCTQVGWFIGTYAYTSPEQINTDVADPRSDLYSWAIVFFEMLTGESPTDSLKDPISFYPTSDEFPADFFTERGVPHELVEVLQKNLRQDRALRYQSASEVIGVLEAIKSQVIANIERHLGAGEEHTKSFEWQAANAEFEQGLTLCRWYDEPNELRGHVRELARRLRMGHLCARGMICLAEREWQAAIAALEPLRTLDPNYLGLDIAAQLRLAQLERQREEKYQLLLQHREHGNWTEIIRLATGITSSYAGGPKGESVGDIRKLALYARGRNLFEEGELERSYYQFHRLYERDPSYEDVAELCATVAFMNGVREDSPTSWEHQVKWLARAVEIDPNHREGRTQQQLDGARHRWAEKLLGEDRRAAGAQLERVSPGYDQWAEVYRMLVSTYYQLLRDGDYSRTERANLDAEAGARYRLGVERWKKGDLQGAVEQLTEIHSRAKEFENAQSNLAQIYAALGDQERKDRRWHKAVEWWDKALAISPSLGRSLQWRIRGAKVQHWIDYHRVVALISAVFTVLAVVVAVWHPWDRDRFGQMVNTTPLATSIVTPARAPVLTTTVVAPSVIQATVTDAPTTSPTSTPSLASPTPSRTPSPTPTASTPMSTPTPTITPSPRPTPRLPTPIPPEPIAPAQGRTSGSPTTFQWHGSLSAGQAYQVTVYHLESGYTIQSELLTDRSWIANLPADKDGEWRWTVSVIQSGRTMVTSSEWMFWFNPWGGDGDGGDGGDGGQPAPTPAQPPTPAEP